jgi:signal transduction histidine kinase/ActR/RegA family two-component response regulator
MRLLRLIRDLVQGRPAAREQALQHEQMRRREAEAIAEVAKSVTRGLDLDAVAQRIADHTRDLLEARVTYVYSLDPASNDLVAIAISGDDLSPFRVGGRLAKGVGLAGLAAAERCVLSTTNVLADPRLAFDTETLDWIERAPCRAVLAAPLFARGEVVGVLAAGDELGRTFSVDDARLAEALADHAAIALENARLYADAEQRRREAVHLTRVAAELTAQLDVAEVGQRVVDTVMPLFRARAAGLRLAQADGSLLGIAFAGLMRKWFAPGHVAPAGSMVSGRAVLEGQPVATVNVFVDPTVKVPDDVREGMTAAGDGAVLAVPLRNKGAIIGALSIADEPGRVFTSAEMELLQAFADQAAVALERARLHEQTEIRRVEAEAAAARDRLLAEASGALASSLDIDTTLARMTEVVVPVLADWCPVRVIEAGGTMRRVATTCADPTKAELVERIQRLTPQDGRGTPGVIGEAIRSGRPLLLRELTPEWLDANVSDRAYLSLVHEIAPRSVMLVPLVVRGRTVGTITFVRHQEGTRYDEADLAVASDLAARAALTIENVRLLQQREQARLDAERANRSKDEFLAMLSHELRTPLTSMLGWVRILRTTPAAADRVAAGLEVIERNARAQAQLIEDLLDVSRIVAGKLQLDRYPVDLVPVVVQAVDSLAREAEVKQVAIERAVVASGLRVLGDPTRLHQILTNLIANAIKFTAPGGRVTVRLERRDAAARISVTDTGVGIAPELLPHVFDRFRQADSTITRTHGGLGLGLAIVRHLVELHGGTVRAESEGTGRGATFAVELPLHTVPDQRAATRPASANPSVRLDGVRVFVVDDDADARELVRFVAESCGAIARAVANVEDAMALVRSERPDVIVTDLGMPDRDGYELLRVVRAAGDEATTIPIIALTAYAGADDRSRALAAGFAAHVTKPVDPATLVQVIADLLSRASASARA